jgi:hypothetical protein
LQALSSGEAAVGLAGMGAVGLAEDQRHNHADANAERQRQHEARHRELGSERGPRIGQRQDVGGRREEQKGDRRPQPGPLLEDAGEQRDNGAGTHGEQASCGDSRGIGDGFRRAAPKKAGDERCWHQCG